jgi:hypothetical protein
MKPITTPAAYALAEEVIKQVAGKSEHAHKHNAARATKSEEFKALRVLLSQRKITAEKIERLVEKLTKNYPGVEIKTYGDIPQVKTRTVYLNNTRDIKNKILIASHVKGLPPQKLVDHVVNEILTNK